MVSENNDGSGWFVPAMDNYHRDYNYGAGLYSLDNRWAVVKGGSACLAQFVNASGSGQAAHLWLRSAYGLALASHR